MSRATYKDSLERALCGLKELCPDATGGLKALPQKESAITLLHAKLADQFALVQAAAAAIDNPTVNQTLPQFKALCRCCELTLEQREELLFELELFMAQINSLTEAEIFRMR